MNHRESRSSLLKFNPQFIIAPGRMVRMMAMACKRAETRVDLAMGVPMEFLTSEMWFCTNCCKNPLFTKVLAEVRNLPILSNMMIMERICPAFGVCPVPYVKKSGIMSPNTHQQLVGGRQVMAARWWMTSALVDQTREAPSGGRPSNWSERKITRAHGTSDTNGALALLPLVEQIKNADHVHAERASTQSTSRRRTTCQGAYCSEPSRWVCRNP